MSLQCQGVGGIILATMVTGFVLMYNSSSSKRSSFSLSSPSLYVEAPVPDRKRPEGHPTSTLEGYTGVMDFKVNTVPASW